MKHCKSPSASARMCVGDDSASNSTGPTDGVLVVAVREGKRRPASILCDTCRKILTGDFFKLNGVQLSSVSPVGSFSLGDRASTTFGLHGCC